VRGRPGDKKCDSCGSMARVLSIRIIISYRSAQTGAPTQRLCEDCLVNAGDLAKAAWEIQGGDPSLAEHFEAASRGETPRRNRALFLLADGLKAAWLRRRGVSTA
jgi:hypothetical protein